MGTLSLESAVAPTVHREVAGFWRRVLAFVIDTFLTAIPCGVLGFVFYQFFTTHRADGILIGFALTLPYFAILGSSVGTGQTLGHRLTDLQVVDQQGKPHIAETLSPTLLDPFGADPPIFRTSASICALWD
jgi:uncharacterized RDD family membrane protein YckC